MNTTQQTQLWLTNTEGYYSDILDIINRHATTYDAAKEIEHYVSTLVYGDTIAVTLASDLVGHALESVDWYTLACNLTASVEPDTQRSESEVVSQLVRKLIDDGCLIEVAQEGEAPEDPMSDMYPVVMNQLFNCDMDFLYVYSGDRQPLGFFSLIYGQSEEDPVEVIADYTSTDYFRSVVRYVSHS